MRRRPLLAPLLALALVVVPPACGARDAVAPWRAGALRVLFVGNSLTYTNDLPAMLRALADSARGARIDVATVTAPGYALEDHWAAGVAPRRIAEGGWSHVVLQQGPSSLPESRANLREWTGRFATPIRAAGAVPVLYMVWPEATRPEAFDAVSESYRLAAADVDGVLVAGGDAWRAVWAADPPAALYGPDGFHPSPLGSYVVALAAYRRLTGRSVTGLPATLDVEGATRWRLALDPAQARRAQEAVDGMAGR